MIRSTLLFAIFVTACGHDQIHLGGSSKATDAGTQAPPVDPSDGGVLHDSGPLDDSGLLDDGGRRNGRGDGGRGDGQHRSNP